jgi:type IV secretion system protein VirB10
MQTDDLMKPMVHQAKGLPPKKIVLPVMGLIAGVFLLLFVLSSEQEAPIQRGDDVAKKNAISLSEADRMQMKGAQKLVNESYVSSGLTPELLLSSQMTAENSSHAPLSNPSLSSAQAVGSLVAPKSMVGVNSTPGAVEAQFNEKTGLSAQRSSAALTSNAFNGSANSTASAPGGPLPMPSGQGVGWAGVEVKNDLLALRAAREVEALNSKMVVADFDDRLSSSAASSSENPFPTGVPKGLGLSDEQSRTLANLRQKAQQLSMPTALSDEGRFDKAQTHLALSAARGSGLNAETARDQNGLQKVTDLMAEWTHSGLDPTGATSAEVQSVSHARNDELFLKEFAKSSAANSGLRPRPMESRRSIVEGSVIPAVLARDIVSDLPGTLTALVSQDVYDSMTSSSVLICKGAKLVGRYNHDVRVGQSRLMFAFTRLILNSGESFDLTGFEGSDELGRAGYEGDVNNHFLKIYGSSLAIGVLADQVTKQSQIPQGAFAQPSATGQIMVQTTRDILSRERDVSPTITIAHGTPINVEVRRDLIFPSTIKSKCI